MKTNTNLNKNLQFKFIKNIYLLSFVKIKSKIKKISTMIWFIFLIILTLFINLMGIFAFIPKGDFLSIMVYKIIESLFLFIFTIYFTIKNYKKELNDNIHSLELRYGFKAKELFISRIVSSLIIILSAYLMILLINLSFGLSEKNLMSIFAYKLYLSSLAWYIMVIFIAYTLSILFVSFFSSIASILLTALVFFLLIFSVFGGGLLASQGFNKNNSNVILLSSETVYKNERKREIKRSLDNLSPKVINNFSNFSNNLKLENDSLPKIIKENKVSFGPKGWTNLSSLKVNNPEFKEIIQLYEDFDRYFDQHQFSFAASDVLGLVDDDRVYDLAKIEPFDLLLKKMSHDVNPKYQGLIKTLFNFNHDARALNELGINYQWFIPNDFWTGGEISPDPLTNITNRNELFNFINDHKISFAEILFYKLLENNIMLNIDHDDNNDHIIDGRSENLKDVNVEQTKEFLRIQQQNLIFNPLVQFSVLFEGVNYYDFGLEQAINERSLPGTVINYTYDLDKLNLNDESTFKVKRIFDPEVIYLVYFLISCLIIFGSYFKFKKNLTK